MWVWCRYTQGRFERTNGEGEEGHRQFCLPKFAHVGLSRAPEVQQRNPCMLPIFQFENWSRTTRCRVHHLFASPEHTVQLQTRDTPHTDTHTHNTQQHSTEHATAQKQREEKRRQDKTRQDKTREEKRREEKRREEKRREEKRREEKEEKRGEEKRREEKRREEKRRDEERESEGETRKV